MHRSSGRGPTNRGMVMGSRIVTEKMIARDKKLHRERLAGGVRSRGVDNHRPKHYAHLWEKRKAAQLRKERAEEIDRQNSLLLERIEAISSRSSKRRPLRPESPRAGYRLDSSGVPVIDHRNDGPRLASLNEGARRKRAKEIHRENLKFAARLGRVRPTFPSEEIDAHAREADRLAHMVSSPRGEPGFEGAFPPGMDPHVVGDDESSGGGTPVRRSAGSAFRGTDSEEAVEEAQKRAAGGFGVVAVDGETGSSFRPIMSTLVESTVTNMFSVRVEFVEGFAGQEGEEIRVEAWVDDGPVQSTSWRRADAKVHFGETVVGAVGLSAGAVLHARLLSREKEARRGRRGGGGEESGGSGADSGSSGEEMELPGEETVQGVISVQIPPDVLAVGEDRVIALPAGSSIVHLSTAVVAAKIKLAELAEASFREGGKREEEVGGEEVGGGEEEEGEEGEGEVVEEEEGEEEEEEVVEKEVEKEVVEGKEVEVEEEGEEVEDDDGGDGDGGGEEGELRTPPRVAASSSSSSPSSPSSLSASSGDDTRSGSLAPPPGMALRLKRKLVVRSLTVRGVGGGLEGKCVCVFRVGESDRAAETSAQGASLDMVWDGPWVVPGEVELGDGVLHVGVFLRSGSGFEFLGEVEVALSEHSSRLLAGGWSMVAATVTGEGGGVVGSTTMLASVDEKEVEAVSDGVVVQRRMAAVAKGDLPGTLAVRDARLETREAAEAYVRLWVVGADGATLEEMRTGVAPHGTSARWAQSWRPDGTMLLGPKARLEITAMGKRPDAIDAMLGIASVPFVALSAEQVAELKAGEWVRVGGQLRLSERADAPAVGEVSVALRFSEDSGALAKGVKPSGLMRTPQRFATFGRSDFAAALASPSPASMRNMLAPSPTASGVSTNKGKLKVRDIRLLGLPSSASKPMVSLRFEGDDVRGRGPAISTHPISARDGQAEWIGLIPLERPFVLGLGASVVGTVFHKNPGSADDRIGRFRADVGANHDALDKGRWIQVTVPVHPDKASETEQDITIQFAIQFNKIKKE